MICNGAGNFPAWIHRFFRFRRFAQHVAPASGSMGYGVPAAVAMKRLYPERTVICVAGDGDFLMNGQEFATAVQYNLPFITIIADNGMYGTIRMHQEREYPGRVSATDLRNPDFADYARAFGGFGISVERTEDFPAAFKEAVASGKPAIVRLAIDPEALTPGMTLSKIREKSLAEKAIEQFQIRDVAMVHRLGRLEIGETSVLIAVASAHRAAAFEACRWLIDTLKRSVPIWKKEYFEDGAVWADGEPFPAEIPRAKS